MSDAVLPAKTEPEMLARAAAIDLPIPEKCLAGVIANLALLTRHAQTLLDGEAG